MHREKEELLALSRRARVRWVLDAAKMDADASASSQGAASPALRASAIPGGGSIQSVLDFLNELCDDGEQMNVETFVSQLPEEETDDVGTFSVEPLVGDLPPFAAFLQRLRKQTPETVATVRSIQQFVAKLQGEMRLNQTGASASAMVVQSKDKERRPMAAAARLTAQADAIFTFLNHCLQEMRQSPPWSHESPAAWTQTALLVEKFLFIKLHSTVFPLAVLDLGSASQDQRLAERVGVLGSFLCPEHLDVADSVFTAALAAAEGRAGSAKVSSSQAQAQTQTQTQTQTEQMLRTWELALLPVVEQLQRASSSRCPLDVVSCLRKAVGAAAAIAQHGQAQAQAQAQAQDQGPFAKANPAGASLDAILPLMILAVVQARPHTLVSLVAFAQAYLLSQQRAQVTASASEMATGATGAISTTNASPLALASVDQNITNTAIPAPCLFLPTLSPDTAFLLTTAASACTFVAECDPVQLSISPAELERSLRLCRDKGSGAGAGAGAMTGGGEHTATARNGVSAAAAAASPAGTQCCELEADDALVAAVLKTRPALSFSSDNNNGAVAPAPATAPAPAPLTARQLHQLRRR